MLKNTEATGYEIQVNASDGPDLSFEADSIAAANALIRDEYNAAGRFGCIGDQVDLPNGGYALLVEAI